MQYKVEKIEGSPKCILGEGPHWDEATQCLYYVDILGKAVFKYNPSTKKHTKLSIDVGTTSIIIPVKGEKDKYLLTVGRKLVVITWDGESSTYSKMEEICEVEDSPETLTNNWNDGKCDSTGRFWGGTFNHKLFEEQGIKTGAFYSLQNGKITQHLKKIGISNGVAFNDGEKKLYYNDSDPNILQSFDFDIEKGTITNKQILYSLNNPWKDGCLDGMAIDRDGNLWVAVFNGFKVIKIDPRKPNIVVDSIPIPAAEVTSVAFGGKYLDELYVTSGSTPLREEDISGPEHGHLYRVTGLGVQGYPGMPAVL